MFLSGSCPGSIVSALEIAKTYLRLTKAKRPEINQVVFTLCARNGNRTHTSFNAHDILSVACLPISPPRRRDMIA